MKNLLHLILLGTALVGASAARAGDADLFAAYDQVNAADIAVAELGTVKGASAEVRSLATMVLRDHAGVLQAARDIAQDNGITYDVPTDNDLALTHKATIEKLSALEGAAFDKAYLAHEAVFHAEAMKAVNEILIPSVENAEFLTHLKTVLPHFEHHLRETLATAEALGYETR